MARIAYILLCHKDPDAIIEQAHRLTGAGDLVAIHFDARSPATEYARIRTALADDPGVTFARRRHRCGWGAWSLVAATLSALEAALEAFPRATHFYMLSGDCMPIKSAEYARALLDADDADYIESVDFHDSDWIKTGLKADRLIYRHVFNERTQRRLFYASYALQKRLRLSRQPPSDLQMRIGSQWWCLRRRTVEWVLDFCRRRPDVVRFFRTTWIPDETFFQTLVRHLVPGDEIRSRTLTFLMFTDYGMPVTFYDDHYDLLLGQDYLFARKISPGATELKRRLGQLYASRGASFPVSGEGRRLHAFLTGRGRVGRRFAPRIWEREATLGRTRELLILACKKWHVGKRLAARIAQVTNLPTAEYLFDEEATPLPELGGIETTLAKRGRHRRALMRLLFDHHGTDRMLICVDPGDFDIISDFFADRCRTRLLEVTCEISDDYLAGHARRVGLAGPGTPESGLSRLLPTLRQDFALESERLRDAGFDPAIWRVHERAAVDENALSLATFLDISEDRAREIAAGTHLFAD